MKPRFNTAENFRFPFPDEEVTESPQITNPSLYSFRTNQRCNQGNAYRQGIQVDELSFSFDDLGIPREKVRDFIENLFKGSPRIGTKISPSSFSRMSERIRIVDNGFSILTFDESNGNNLPVILGEIFHQIALLLSYNISLSAAEFQKENREDVLRRYFGNEGFRSILRLSKNKERYDLSPTLCGICSEKFKEYFSDDFFTVKEVPKLSFWSIPDSRFEESIINNVIEEINFYLLGLSNLSTQDLEAISQYFDEHQEEILNYMRNTMGLIMSFINGGNHYSRILGENQ